MSGNFTIIRDGLKDVVAGVDGITQVLTYEPGSVQVHKLAWVLLDSYQRSQYGQVTTMNYRFRISVTSPSQDFRIVEDQLVQTAMDIADAIDANPQFNDVLVSGLSRSQDGAASWLTVAGIKYRVVDIFASVLDTFAYKGAI